MRLLPYILTPSGRKEVAKARSDIANLEGSDNSINHQKRRRLEHAMYVTRRDFWEKILWPAALIVAPSMVYYMNKNDVAPDAPVEQGERREAVPQKDTAASKEAAPLQSEIQDEGMPLGMMTIQVEGFIPSEDQNKEYVQSISKCIKIVFEDAEIADSLKRTSIDCFIVPSTQEAAMRMANSFPQEVLSLLGRTEHPDAFTLSVVRMNDQNQIQASKHITCITREVLSDTPRLIAVLDHECRHITETMNGRTKGSRNDLETRAYEKTVRRLEDLSTKYIDSFDSDEREIAKELLVRILPIYRDRLESWKN